MEKFYITTAIDYMNGEPHLGHAYEKIASDVLARHFKQRGIETFFLTGSDEHGAKIEKTAQGQGISPQEFCDSYSDKFKKAWNELDIDYDRYIRTTEEAHKKVVEHIFKTLQEKGDIYKASYSGIYCNGCESFLATRELDENGHCPTHKTKPQEVKEENYFFKLSKYKDKIINHIKQNPDFILPTFRAKEVLNQLETIEDISVSRSKEAVTWGIEVPEDNSQVIYVWIDALSNYLTGCGYLTDMEKFRSLWSEEECLKCHMIGKDILKFHAIYWIGILMAMELKLPKTIFAHGWITIDQAKMSKSTGNTLAPSTVLEQYELESPDPLRYFLMTTCAFGKDGNYSDEDFKAKVNADLANNLGNLLNRTLSMLIKYFDGEIKKEFVDRKSPLKDFCNKTKTKVIGHFDRYELTEAVEAVIALIDGTNKYVNDKAPWALVKENKTECGKVLYDVLETMRHAGVMLYPFIPSISQQIFNQLSAGNVEEIKLNSLQWGELQTGKIITKENLKPVFLRLDSELAQNKKYKKE